MKILDSDGQALKVRKGDVLTYFEKEFTIDQAFFSSKVFTGSEAEKRVRDWWNSEDKNN